MQICRSDLYERVSASPLSKVAPSFGIPATKLAAICREHRVPYPGSGYWTRKSLGLPTTLEPLPITPHPDERPITILPQEQRRPRTQVRSFAEDGAGQAAPMPDKPAAPAGPPPTVRERLVKSHPIIAEWLANHERRRQEALTSRDEWRIRTAPAPLSDLDKRRHRILNALFRALEARGAKVSPAEKGLLRVTIDGEKIDFQVREKNRQVKPTDSKRGSQELVGTGKLVFAFRTYLRGPHNEEWPETDKRPLESQLPRIVERFFEGAQILKDWHIEQEQERERWRQEAVRRAELERLAKQEDKRRSKLGELASNWHTATQIRTFVAVVRAKPFDAEANVHGRSLAEWIAWAEAAADALDASSQGPEGVFAIIGSVQAERGWG